MTSTPGAPGAESPFRSFWMGGYEGADHVNGERRPLDIAHECGHVDRLEEDHRRAAELGIGTIRESIGWRLAEPAPGRYDLARATRIARSAQAHGLQVVWTLMHYGTPDDVDLRDDRFVERFRRFARVVADRLAPWSDGPPVYNPINEISFVSWAMSTSNLMWPHRGDEHAGGRADPPLGYEVKKRLIRATLEAIDAMRAVDPRARFLHVDPMVHVAAPYARPDQAGLAVEVTNYQWQTWDMVEGRREPQLGGSPEALDLIGINHYHSSQWEAPSGERLWWHARDPRRRPFAALLADCWARYRRPMIVAETSHFGDGRADWLEQIAAEVREARAGGVPVEGICLYPLVDRPDWTEPGHWHHSGLWDVVGAARVEPGEAPFLASPLPSAAAVRDIDPATGTSALDAGGPAPGDDRSAAAGSTPDGATPIGLRRVLAEDYAAALRRWQRELPAPPDGAAVSARPCLLVYSPWRWDGLWHRPQQLLTRLAERWRVVYVEEPLAADAARLPHVDRIHRRPGIEVWVPRLPGPMHGFDPEARARLEPLLAKALREAGVERPLVWCATPLALPLAEAIGDRRGLVYDCCDELAGFDGASPELAELEPRLLREADRVFCAGPALAAEKARWRPDLLCVPNGVEPADWQRPRDPESHDAREVARLQRAIDRPRLGYAGAIDERLDLALVAALAAARPDWQLVLVGPVCKVDPAELPRAPNLHWLPWQPYGRLPAFYASWDVCLLPFRLGPATCLANPTKLLEYRAAGRPVVATPLPDVLALHGQRIQVADGPADFIAACTRALALGRGGGAAARGGHGANDAAHAAASDGVNAPLRTWDRCVEEIEAAIRSPGAITAAPHRP